MIDERLNLPSASMAERFIRCPGSESMIKANAQLLPQESESPEASEGTLIHEGLEEDDFEELDMSQANIAERLKMMRETEVAKWREQRGISAPGDEYREERFFLRDQETLEPICSAKVDYALVCGNEAIIINYKTGYLKTEPAAANWQCRTEALCLWSEIKQIERIRVGVAQYRFKAAQTLSDLERADLQLAMIDFWRGVWSAKQPDAPRYPGHWCRYCPCAKAGLCLEAINWALVTNAMIAKNGGPKNAPPEVLVQIKRRWSLSQYIYDAINDRLKSLPEDKLEKLGLKLVKGIRVQNLKDLPGMYGKLLEMKLVDQNEFVALFEGAKIKGKLTELIGPRLKKNLGLEKKSEVDATIENLLRPYMEEHEGNKRLKEIAE